MKPREIFLKSGTCQKEYPKWIFIYNKTLISDLEMNAFPQNFEHSNLFSKILSANGNAKSIYSLFLGRYKVMFE